MRTYQIHSISFLLILFLSIYGALAQAPQKFSYQAVIRGADNEVLQNLTVKTQISIIQGSVNGSIVYSEIHTPMTNSNGLFTIQIGDGTSPMGNFSDIDWSTGPYFIKTETDPTGGANYTITGINQLLSVPYALYAENAGNMGTGPEGPEGKSAYQVWLDEGNSGSESDFIISLIGADGADGKSAYDLWLEAGNTGSIEDFLVSLIGSNGLDGKSAYDLWLEAGNTGSISDFLNSLIGPAGPSGSSAHELWLLAGNSGPVGDFLQSLIGPEGKSAYQSWLDEGNVGTEADFINSLIGATGVDGKSAYQVWIDEGNVGTEADFIASLEGPQGPIGGYPQHYIGESYGGGIVFYVYDNGQHGLIAATVDQSAGTRWSQVDNNTRATGDGVGAGEMNTMIIMAKELSADPDDFAAAICSNYFVDDAGVTYGDWYLPSKHELNLLYLQKGVVGMPNMPYWSSTEDSSIAAWRQNFDDGTQNTPNKSAPSNVRAIRAF